MEFKIIKDFENYKLYENGEIYNNKLNNKIKTNKRVKLSNDFTKKTFVLSRIIYETFCNDKLKNTEIIKFKDNDENNYHYKNLIKIDRKDMFKVENHIELDTNKEWKFIKEYDDYKISNYGDIFSLKSNKMLKATKNLENYYSIKLIKNNNRKCFLVHRLVFNTFKNIDDYDKVIDHIDNNPSNNFIENLREVSKSENSYNRIFPNKNMVKIYQYSLNNEFIKEWNNYSDIKNTLNFNSCLISNCCLNKIKKAYNFIWKYSNVIYDKKELENFKNIIVDNNDNTFSNYKINKNGDIINQNNMLLKPHIQHGYKSLELVSIKKINKKFKVHRLVALTFLENPHNFDIVNHIDENKLNNNIINLKWCNHKENITYSYGKKINQIDIKTNKIINTYNSINEAFNKLNKTYGNNIRLAIDGKRKTAFGYKWEYLI